MSSAANLSEAQRSVVMDLAQKTVIAVTNARLRADVDDSTLVIHSYCKEAMEITGCDLGTAWALLFSAALANFSDAIIDISRLQETTPAHVLAEWALSFEQAGML
jgi:hypothetical protein